RACRPSFPTRRSSELAQLEAVMSDIPPHAIKTGALGEAAVVRAVGHRLRRYEGPLIVDPVLASTDGSSLTVEDAREALLETLLPDRKSTRLNSSHVSI